MDRIKIDGSSVRGVLTNRQSEAALALDLNMSTAEYAESGEVIERLRALGVHRRRKT